MIIKCMKRIIAVLTLLYIFTESDAQEGSSAYSFLDIPVSAHSAALGGNNVSIIEDDITLMYTNPAALANVSDKTLNLNFTSYFSGTSKLSAAFAKASGERGTWAAAAEYLNYGSMTETNESHEELGKISAKDFGLMGGYCYSFSDKWVGAAIGKALFSNYGNYSSIGLGVDLGVNYFDEANGLSLGLVARNLGGQVKAFEDKYEAMPFNLVFGISKDLNKAPIRISLTLSDLTHWSNEYYSSYTGEDLSFGKILMNHVALGVDIFPTKTTWVAVGYNFRRAYEMKVNDSSHWAGFSIGGGISIKRFKIGIAYGKYHVASSSILANASFSL